MKISTSPSPTIDATSDFCKSSLPRIGPTSSLLMIVSGTGSAPALSSLASVATWSSVNEPWIMPSVEMMPSIVAALTYFLSRKIVRSWPMWSRVSCANLVEFFVVKSTCGSPPGPKPGCALLSSAPE